MRAYWPGAAALLALAAALRFSYPTDIEFKEDEDFMFRQSWSAGVEEPWPWTGLGSTQWIPNPGASVWVFAGLRRLFLAWDPVELTRSVAALSWIALLLSFWFGAKRLSGEARRVWFWGTAIACLNPFAVAYSRKIWAQSVLPIVSIGVLLAWSARAKTWASFAWGALGAIWGQVHMSGFFHAAGLVAATLFHGEARARTSWKAWLLGSSLASLPLLPWLAALPGTRIGGPVFFGWEEILRLRYWVFLLTSPLGLHLGGILGVSRGDESTWVQLREFAAMPSGTWLIGAAHLALAGLGATTLVTGLARRRLPTELRVPLVAFGLASGILLTATTIVIRRFYLIGAFPIDSVLLAALAASAWSRASRVILPVVAALNLVLSLGFLGFVRQHAGAPNGDFGPSYRIQPQSARLSPGRRLPESAPDAWRNRSGH